MTLVNSFTKTGVPRPFQIETDDFGIFKPVSGTSVPGLHIIGQPRGLSQAVWYPIYSAETDVP